MTIDENTKISWHIAVYLLTIAFGAGMTVASYRSIDSRLTRIENRLDAYDKVSMNTIVDSSGGTQEIALR